MIHLAIDAVHADRITGWAADAAAPHSPVVLDVISSRGHVVRTLANAPRPDLDPDRAWCGFDVRGPGIGGAEELVVRFATGGVIRHEVVEGVQLSEKSERDGELRKFDVAHLLASSLGLNTYLEIVTPSTGLTFYEVSGDAFTTRHRLMYRCPPEYNDGREIAFRTAEPTPYNLVRALKVLDPKLSFDMIFVDAFHNFDQSRLDLLLAVDLLRPGGVLLVHDCLPPTPDSASPTQVEGNWCGETYRAWIDLVASDALAGYATVAADFGCGIGVTPGPEPAPRWLGERLPREVHLAWTAAVTSGSAFTFFREHAARLLNVLAPDEFEAAI